MDLLFSFSDENDIPIHQFRVSGTPKQLDKAIKEIDSLLNDMAKARLALWPDERASDPEVDGILEVYRHA